MIESQLPRYRYNVTLMASLAVLILGRVAPAGPVEVTGSLGTVNGVRVLKLWGTPEERGYAHGYLLGAQIVANFEKIVLDERIIASPGDYETKVRRNALRMLHFGGDYNVEVEAMYRGIADAVGVDGLRLERLGRDLDARDLMAMNSLADWYSKACSSFSAWGEATEGGEMITARNLDFIPLPGLEDLHLLIAYLEPGPGRQPWVSVAWPGVMGAYSAMNAQGVTGSVHEATPLRGPAQLNCVPRSIGLREAMEVAQAATAIADVERTLRRAPSMTGDNVHVSSPFTGQPEPAAVFEHDGRMDNDKGVTRRTSSASPLPVWLTCTNHFCVRMEPPPAAPDQPFDTVTRYNAIATALESAVKSQTKIDLAWARKTMLAVSVEGKDLLTLHTVFYLPNRKEMYVCFAQSGAAAPKSDPVRIVLEDILRK